MSFILDALKKSDSERQRQAGPALLEVRRREVRNLSDAEALEAAEDLLSMADCSPVPPERLVSSGLVAQQALFHRRARP